MIKKVREHLQKVAEFKANDSQTIEQFRISYAGKKGILNDLFAVFREVPNEEKKEFGQVLNQLKTSVLDKVNSLKALQNSDIPSGIYGDLSRPVFSFAMGSQHPLTVVRDRIIDIFSQIGFNISEGPEIEDDWHNFSALNLPEEHPARDMQDTFFIQTNPDTLLRTHTSPVQIRHMEQNQPPIRTISPGRVYRNEAISSRAHCIFHQVEGLYIDKSVSFADLKQTLLYFAKEIFGEKTKIRLRPSYFPFTEPSAEVDVSCNICSSKGCNVCKYTGYLEILGCGMVDPNVLDNCGIDSKKYTGFAFGMGIERIAMLKYQVDDLRLFYENDIRFLKQFSNSI